MIIFETFDIPTLEWLFQYSANIKLTIHLSFLTFQLFCALFCKTANQSLYTSHNITDFVHFDSARNLTRNLFYRPLWRFVKIPIIWREWWNARWEKWLARRFTKCRLYTSCFSRFPTVFRVLVNLPISV